MKVADFRRYALGCCVAAICAMVSLPASAKGVTLVQQSDGSVKTYADVYISIIRETLTLRTADRKGTLRIVTGACSFVSDVQRCLPYSVMLAQHGKTRSIGIAYGTVFLNLTKQARRLPASSQVLAPRTVLVLFKTVHGTYVTVKGTLDEVKP